MPGLVHLCFASKTDESDETLQRPSICMKTQRTATFETRCNTERSTDVEERGRCEGSDLGCRLGGSFTTSSLRTSGALWGGGGGQRGERQREREESGLRGLRVQTKGSLDSGFAPQVCRSMVLGVSALVTVVFKELIQGN